MIRAENGSIEKDGGQQMVSQEGHSAQLLKVEDRWMATGSRQQARSAIAHSPHLLDTEGRGMGIAEKTGAGLLGGRGTDLDEALASDSSGH
jgi:hypothetical protein